MGFLLHGHVSMMYDTNLLYCISTKNCTSTITVTDSVSVKGFEFYVL